ncbi:MAG: protein meaA [Alphaproteobacteria bacterium]
MAKKRARTRADGATQHGPAASHGGPGGRARDKPKRRARDEPWIFRTYSGHSSAQASNQLFRTNLEAGQTGLSIAFDLPTQTGYDSDHALARGEVGRVGVPVRHLGDMEALFADIPLADMNTSMTINATAPWLLALYIVAAEAQGAKRRDLAGTVQNDILKEYLSRGTHIFPPGPSLRLATDVIEFTSREMPRWNPVNICSYHLQEAGATPVEELAFALANATCVLDAVRETGRVAPRDFPALVGRLSFFVNAGLHFITELAKLRAFAELWDEICRERYGVEEEKFRRFRYGVQVNSLGLTEQQPENNVYRILLEMLAVVLSKNTRARAVQLPAWNEALGLPRPWDQQWSLRLQQIVAHETDLLDHDDIFEGSRVIGAKVAELKAAARAELAHIEQLGGAVEAVRSGYMKERLVASNAARLDAIVSGERIVVGVNKFTESAPSPLTRDRADGDSFLTVDPREEARQIAELEAWRAGREEGAVAAALADLGAAARDGRNIMEPSIACARARVTTGEWGEVLREIFGDYRAPTGLGTGAGAKPRGQAREAAARRVAEVERRLGRKLRLLVAKPGLDGHSNGAEQIALAARDAGMEVIYEGIRLTPDEIAASALEEGVDVVGLSILSGGHLALAGDIVARLAARGVGHVPVILGGIVPEADRAALKEAGIAAVYTPKDYDLGAIVAEIAEIAERAAQAAA